MWATEDDVLFVPYLYLTKVFVILVAGGLWKQHVAHSGTWGEV